MTFEEWCKSRLTMDGYPQYTAEDAWQASRRTALEEAAKVCDDLESRISKAMLDAHERNGSKIDGGYLNACDDCAESIRALAASDSDGGKDE